MPSSRFFMPISVLIIDIHAITCIADQHCCRLTYDQFEPRFCQLRGSCGDINSAPVPWFAGFDISPLKPCCVAQSGTLCGDLDSDNRPRYTLCSVTSKPFFWDENHPTEAGWKKVFNLYVTDPLFTHKQSLPTFLGVATQQVLINDVESENKDTCAWHIFYDFHRMWKQGSSARSIHIIQVYSFSSTSLYSSQ